MMSSDGRSLAENMHPIGVSSVDQIATVPSVTLLNSGRADSIQRTLDARLMQRDASSGMPAAAPVMCACPAEF